MLPRKLVRRAWRWLAVPLALTAWASAEAADSVARLNFVACPIVRDTPQVPCWITRYKGETYFLGIQQDITADFYPPQLKHRILVEGVVTTAPRICGGIVLKPVVVSVLPEIDLKCDRILPAGPYRIDFNARGAGPNHGGTPATGAAAPPRPPASSAEGVAGPKTFTVRFDFDSDYMTLRNTAQVSAAARYAAVDPDARVKVEGLRAATLLSDGKPMVEAPAIARQRAEKVAQALREIGVPADYMEVTWRDASGEAKGVDDYRNRRVDIRVIP